LQGIAARLVEEARRGGADVAEASASSGWELTAKVRLGQPELVQEAGTRNVALRVIRSQRVAVTSTSDWTEEGLKPWVSDALALSSGFSALRRGSFVSLAVVPVVEDQGGKKRRGHYWSGHRHLSGLEPLEVVGRKAAERTLRQLGARKVPTCTAPIVFEADA